MLRTLLTAAAATCCLLGAQTASAHTGGSNCNADLVEVGATYQNECEFPFKGFPIGVAGVHSAGEPGRGSEIHVEVLARTAASPPRPLGVECTQAGPEEVSRCTAEYNPLTAPVTAVEPVPTEILSLICAGHSHAKYSRNAPPSGKFACWSTDEGREDLENDGVMEEIGYSDTEPEPDPSETPDPLAGLGGSGVSPVVTAVPVNTYAPDTVPVIRSLGLRFLNLDTARHDVVARTATRPDGSAGWCDAYEDPEDPAAEDCPLFWSELIPGGGTETPVLGLEDAEPGSYDFYCTIHPYMSGKIEVLG